MAKDRIKVPTAVEIDFNRFEPRHRLDALQAFTANVNHYSVPKDMRDRVRGRVTARNVAGAVIQKIEQSAALIARDKFMLRNAVSGFLLVRLYLSGTSRRISNDTVIELKPGALHLWDCQMPIKEISDDVVFLSAGIPFSKVGYDPASHPAHMIFDANTAVGTMLSTAFEALHQVVPDASANKADLAAEGFFAMLRSILAGHVNPDDPNLTHGRQSVVLRYIEANLLDGTLDAASVCATLGISRAALYRLPVFAEHGGFDAFVRRRRLDMALMALSDAPTVRGNVGKVAENCRFHDQASFTRQFRRAFGIAPGEVLGLSFASRDPEAMAAAIDSQDHPPVSLPSQSLVELYSSDKTYRALHRPNQSSDRLR